jgi:hypothetical protein
MVHLHRNRTVGALVDGQPWFFDLDRMLEISGANGRRLLADAELSPAEEFEHMKNGTIPANWKPLIAACETGIRKYLEGGLHA